jgi:hypothetical protein
VTETGLLEVPVNQEVDLVCGEGHPDGERLRSLT